MRKVFRWLGYLAVAVTIWLSLTFSFESKFNSTFTTIITLAPLEVLFLFGMYSAGRIMINLATFPTCEPASISLKQEMKEAQTELTKLGFDFEKFKRMKEESDKKAKNK